MPKEQQPNNWGSYAGIGFQLIAITLFLVWVGKWADEYFKSSPIGLLVGIFLAVFGVIYVLIKKLK